jgi:hypothetical protein
LLLISFPDCLFEKRAQFYHKQDELKDVNGQKPENHFETLALARSILQNMPVESP